MFKNDKYKRARGNYSRLLTISCADCSMYICNYPKDGPGILKRMYVDRITNSVFAGPSCQSPQELERFECPNCNQTVRKKERPTALVTTSKR